MHSEVVVEDDKNNNNNKNTSTLYGRKHAIEELEQAFHRCCDRHRHRRNIRPDQRNNDDNNNSYRYYCELVFISGQAGSGKTTLAKQTLQRLTQQPHGGLFGSGKFDCIITTSSHHHETHPQLQQQQQNDRHDCHHNNSNNMIASSREAMPLLSALAEWIRHILLLSCSQSQQQQQQERSMDRNFEDQAVLLIQSIRQELLQQLSEESHELLRRIIPGYESIAPRKNHHKQNNNTNNTFSSVCNEFNAKNLMITSNINMDMKVILTKFIIAMSHATGKHDLPLVLFLDDLQWADQMTMDVIHDVVLNRTSNSYNDNNNQQQHLLLIVGAFRHEEMSPSHALSHTMNLLMGTTTTTQVEVDGSSSNNETVTHIRISNLTEEDIIEMVSDAIQCSKSTTTKLASGIYRQTKGNALFVRQAIKSLLDVTSSNTGDHFDEQDLWNAFDGEEQPELLSCCVPQPTTLKEKPCADFLQATVKRMKEYDPYIQNQLMVASSLGNHIPIDVLQAVTSDTVYNTNETTITIPNSENCTRKHVLVTKGHLETRQDDEDGSLLLQWQHDLIWQAAYSLILEHERPLWHLSIGRKLLRSLPPARIEETIFLILNQYSQGFALLSDADEKAEVAKLCLRAGEKAALASSFQTASSCLNLGIAILDDDAWWKREYDLCLMLRNNAAESSFCVADFERMDQHLNAVLQHARTYTDSLRARTIQIYALGSRGRHLESHHLGVETLRCLGVLSWRRAFWMVDYFRTVHILQKKKDRTLLSLPPMNDERKLASMSIMFVLSSICTNCCPKMLPFLTTATVRMTLKFGMCPAASQAFLSYGLSRLLFGKRQESFRFGQLGLDIVEMLNAKEFLPKSYLIMYTYINPWNRPLRDSIEPLVYAFCAGLETGDIDTAVKCRFQSCKLLLWSGRNLPEVQLATSKSYDFLNRYKQDGFKVLHKALLQFCDNLMVRTNDPMKLSGNAMNQDEAYRIARETNNNFLLVDLPMLRLWLAVYLNNYELALEVASESRMAIKRGKILYFVVCLHRFYEGVTAICRAQQVNNQNKKLLIKMARRSLKELTLFEKDVPENCQNKVVLLEALLAAENLSTINDALRKFDRSINLARAEGFVHEQALACELAGSFLRRNFDFVRAKYYIMQARDLYQQWGATVKVHQMTNKYNLDETCVGREDKRRWVSLK